MKALAALALLGACGGWTVRDTALELTAAGLITADWRQTNQIIHGGWEGNPLIGKNGEVIPPNVYFPVMAVVHAAVAVALPSDWRLAWQTLFIGAEANTVWVNYASGYSPL